MNSQINKKGENKKVSHRSATEEEIKMLEKEALIAPGMKCPRCDKIIDYIRVDEIEYVNEKGEKKIHDYFYAGHKNVVSKKTGKKNVEWHYLGAKEYDYVERFNELGLQGLVNSRRENRYLHELLGNMTIDEKFTARDFENMLDAILFNLDKVAIDDNEREILLEKIKKIQEKIEEKK